MVVATGFSVRGRERRKTLLLYEQMLHVYKHVAGTHVHVDFQSQGRSSYYTRSYLASVNYVEVEMLLPDA